MPLAQKAFSFSVLAVSASPYMAFGASWELIKDGYFTKVKWDFVFHVKVGDRPRGRVDIGLPSRHDDAGLLLRLQSCVKKD